MRIWGTERGFILNTKYRTKTPYVEIYTQPVHNYIIARLHRKWTRLTWPVVRLIEKLDRREHEWYDVPLGCRQDIRGYFLYEKNRKIVMKKYEKSTPIIF